MAKRILFAVHDWGLGHASRSLVLIRALLEHGNALTVLMAPSAGLQLLKSELGDACEFYSYADIPKPFSRYPAMFYVRMSLAMPWVGARIALEHRLTERLVRARRFDLIVSDSRFGVWSREVPSYCIFHSLRQIIPGRPRLLERFVECGQRRLLRGFARVLIPDVEANQGLSGDLSHEPDLNWGEDRLVYLGPLSGVRQRGLAEDIDYFFSISGIEPQRSLFEELVLAALPRLGGRIVVTRGEPSAAGEKRTVGSATVHGYLDRRAQEEMLNRARVTVTRSGYTTLMELAELGKKALFVPTPGQSEQEYLAEFHGARGHVRSTTQARLELPQDLTRADAASGVPKLSSDASVRRFFELLA